MALLFGRADRHPILAEASRPLPALPIHPHTKNALRIATEPGSDASQRVSVGASGPARRLSITKEGVGLNSVSKSSSKKLESKNLLFLRQVDQCQR